MKKPPSESKFQTHIAEPRWQQVSSVIIVGLLAAAWIWFAFFSN